MIRGIAIAIFFQIEDIYLSYKKFSYKLFHFKVSYRLVIG